jgi:hypothetical protein
MLGRRTLAAVMLAASLLVAACGSSAPASVRPAATPSPAGSAASPAVAGSAVPSSSTAPEATPAPAGSASPGSSIDPAAIDPADFVSTIDNPWFPLIPGTTLTYRGVKDRRPAVDVLTVTNRTTPIDGVICRVIDDRLYLGGVLAEKTSDYYVQDRSGNVWYFGEDTAELDADGHVTSREGTWHAGVDGAIPGIFMPADPSVGATGAQELYPGHAEDHFEVVSLGAKVNVPYGAFDGALLTKEWTPLEPGVLDHKYYLRGVGVAKETTVTGPKEVLNLVKVVRP